MEISNIPKAQSIQCTSDMTKGYSELQPYEILSKYMTKITFTKPSQKGATPSENYCIQIFKDTFTSDHPPGP